MSSIDEQVIDFYYELFDRIFTQPFRPTIKERLRRDAVSRQIEEAAGAASQAAIRFFLSEQLTEQQVTRILRGFIHLYDLIKLEDVANPNRTPEALVDEILKRHPCPTAVSEVGSEVIYRVALNLTVQVLMLVGPVMTEWQRLSFSSTYEMPRRIVTQLNQITEGLKAFASAGQAAADERYELAYRDHLLQRFYRVEAGTVRMTTNLNVDLRELFVMPRLTVRPKRPLAEDGADGNVESLMNLSAARAVFGTTKDQEAVKNDDQGIVAIEQVRSASRNVFVGVPGSGKSTFFEWLQLSVANVDEELIAGRTQAIPLLLRVRQLDPKNLPRGADLIEKATASRDRATLMPDGWIDRQMKTGRVLFMLDGLDETEPSIRDDYVLPWLDSLCEKYPDCLYQVSSRPVGYPPGALRKLEFVECDLDDFEEPEIVEYARHWCTAIRLAQNEPDDEARREGAKEGDQIVAGFKGHPYIGNLARNPLMLSAICLVNYFEGGELPKDRAKLYKLCVEGLLHHWDQRRGIRSEYSLAEKLRVCREVAIAMQADDRAGYEVTQVLRVFTTVLKDQDRAKRLLEHIRYRTGLLIERRAGVFAFTHLTFQEYLAACAVYEGNLLAVDIDHLAREHKDGRWKEVIALYCGLASAKDSRLMIRNLITQGNTASISGVLAEAFLSASAEVTQDDNLRKQVLERIAIAPTASFSGDSNLSRFRDEEVTPVTNSFIGGEAGEFLSESFTWLDQHPERIDEQRLENRLHEWQKLNAFQLWELIYLVHVWGSDKLLGVIADHSAIYRAAFPLFSVDFIPFRSQAEIALIGLARRLPRRPQELSGGGFRRAFLELTRVIAEQEKFRGAGYVTDLFKGDATFPEDVETATELISLVRKIARRVKTQSSQFGIKSRPVAKVMNDWADRLEAKIKGTAPQRAKTTNKRRRKA